MFRLSVMCLLVLFAPLFTPVAAAAQTLSDDYRALLEDAAAFEDGAHFDATVRLVARNAEGGAEAVAAALDDADPEAAARARDILGLPAAAPEAVAEAEPEAADIAEERGVLGRVTHALISPPKEDPLWTGRVSAGLRWDEGNSDQQDYTLGLQVERDLRVWGLEASLDYAYSEANGAVSRDRLNAEALGERELGERWTAFVQGDFERDAISSYDYTAFAGAGVGYRLFDRPNLSWTLRAAPGVRYQQPATGGSETGLAAELSSDAEWDVNERLTLGSETTMTIADASRAEQIFSAITEVGGGWGAQAKYRYRYEFDPQPGFGRTDSRLDISLVKEF